MEWERKGRKGDRDIKKGKEGLAEITPLFTLLINQMKGKKKIHEKKKEQRKRRGKRGGTI